MGEGSLALTVAGGVRPETLAAGPLPNHATYQRYHEEEGFGTIGTFFSNENWVGLSPDGSPMITPRPLSPRAVADAALGRFYHGDARSFEIRVFEGDGTPIRIIRGSETPRPITDEIVSEYVDSAVARYEDPVRRNEQRERLAQISFPQQLPAYSELIVAADGHVWVADYRLPWEEQPAWTVFDAEGRERPSDADDGGPRACVGSEDPVVAMSMNEGRRNEAGQSLEQLEGCEPKLLATVHIGLGEPVDQAGLLGA